MTAGRHNAIGDVIGEIKGGVQLDLFGEVEKRLDAAAEFERRARFMPDGSPVMWVAKFDCHGIRKGDQMPGWRCWLCGQIEVNDYQLTTNHGLAAHYPDTLDWAECTKQERQARQARAAEARQAAIDTADEVAKQRARKAAGPGSKPVRKPASKAASKPVQGRGRS